MFSSQIQHKYHLSSVFSHPIVLCMKYWLFVLYSLWLFYCIAIFFFIYWHIPASFHHPERTAFTVEKCNSFCGCRKCLRPKSVRKSFGGPTRRWSHQTSATAAAEASAGSWVCHVLGSMSEDDTRLSPSPDLWLTPCKRSRFRAPFGETWLKSQWECLLFPQNCSRHCSCSLCLICLKRGLSSFF